MDIQELIEQCKKMGMPQSTIHEGVKVIIIPIEYTKREPIIPKEMEREWGTGIHEVPMFNIEVEGYFGVNELGTMKPDKSVNLGKEIITLAELMGKSYDIEKDLKELRRLIHIQLYGRDINE